ncbi:translation initiation factor IF-2 subunit gamma [Thermofilum pendens]|uniref:Translation initiation factor 2 subunit gamma n=1 Tax=Thermofilum pendens (strain DSM 2475 / Hrk 5) TaxID=368408 RepID=A1RXN9_THEPD|nr:translation initiation factor IF-2 subunit gamma [Thermofilum pendens]ABL77969.1 translation initiation factor 2 subunit gamma (aeIF-2g) [Thermofilum pendens Hrk 5]
MSEDEFQEALKKQPLVNIGTSGHVDHGKTTLIEALTGVWASRHSEELKRGITLKIGYADTAIYKCPKCPPPQAYYTSATMPKDGKCKYCGSPLEFVRKVSFIDVPGHEMLMSIMLAGAALMDGALLVVDATKECPQPQTREHFTALSIIGVRNLVIVQNKVDVVSKERALESYNEIKKFIAGTWAENAPIVPVSALHKANIDALVWAIEEYIPTPRRDFSKPPRMFVIRSFDVNKPGTNAKDLVGGVLGGTIVQGRFEVGHEIEIRPGIKIKKDGQEVYEPVYTTITSLKTGDQPLEKAYPGGLVAVGTTLDPSVTKADNLIGNVVGYPGTLPPTLYDLEIEVNLLERVVGLDKPMKVEPVRAGEILMVNVGTALSIGAVTSVRDNVAHMKLKIPVVAETGTRVAISRQLAGKWRLIGYGFVK